MADAYTNADAIGLYHSGAKGTQLDPDACLGGDLSSTEAKQIRALITNPIAPIIVHAVSGENDAELPSIVAFDANTIGLNPTDVAPGGSIITRVAIADGETKLIAGTFSINKWARVERDGSDSLGIGTMSLSLSEEMNNVVGMDNVTDAERAAGNHTYRGTFIKAHGSGSVTDLKVWLDASTTGIEIGKELPVDNAIQTIANESTAPGGISWNSGTSSGTGLDIGTLAAGSSYGLWIHREITAGASVDTSAQTIIFMSFTFGVTGYQQRYFGRYRIADDALDVYELYIGEDAEPDLSLTPDATSATLPFTSALATPVSGEVDYRMVVRRRNAYDLASFNVHSRSIVVDDGGDEVASGVSAPEGVTVTEVGGGVILITAQYFPDRDSSPADKFRVYVTEGADPIPGSDTPTLASMTTAFNLFNPSSSLSLESGPYARATDLRILVTSYRTSDAAESTNTTATQHTLTRADPGIPANRLVGMGSYSRVVAAPVDDRTIYIDQPNNIRWEMSLGQSELWGDSVLIWRAKYDCGNSQNVGIWTTFGFTQAQQSGAPTGTVSGGVEVASWTGGDKTLYIIVAGVRRLQIDVTNSRIYASAMTQVDLASSRNTDPVDVLPFNSLVQVLDRCVWNYETAMSIDVDGVMHIGIPWQQRQTTGEFE